MAEGAILGAIFEALIRDLAREAAEVSEIPGELSNLRKEFESLKGFLGDAEERQDDDLEVRKWLRDIKDLVYEAQEITEKHLHRIARHRAAQAQPGRWNSLKRCPRTLFDAVVIAREASQIHNLTHKFTRMTCKMKAYGIEYRQADLEPIADNPATTAKNYEDERMIVGLDEDIKTIENQLVSSVGISTHNCKVVGICGVNGLGKTTLAKEVIRSKRVEEHFDAIAWAFVGPDFQVGDVLKKVLLDLIKERDDEIEDHVLLSAKISQILIEKRCLVVLDDFQTPAIWDSLQTAFSSILFESTNSFSKLLLTTCHPHVVSYVDPQASLHQLRFLNSEERWELFLKKTRSSWKGSFDNFVTKMIWKPVINQCAGLPLTIHLLGGLCSSGKGSLGGYMIKLTGKAMYHSLPLTCHLLGEDTESTTFWGRHRECGDRNMSTLELEAEQVLCSCDTSLKPRLRLCLLEMLDYPAGFAIWTEELFTKWIDKGIISPSSTAEKSAQRFLAKLVLRSLVQVVDMDGDKIKSCQLHSVVRGFYIKLPQQSFNLSSLFAKSLKQGLDLPTTKGPALVSL